MAIYRGLSSRPSPKPRKCLKKVSRGLRPRGPRESGKSLEKVFSGPFQDFFQTLETFSRLFPDSRGALGPEAPGDFFSDFFGVSGPEGPRVPVNGQRVPNLRAQRPKKKHKFKIGPIWPHTFLKCLLSLCLCGNPPENAGNSSFFFLLN